MLVLLVSACLPIAVFADEGMWTVDNFPSAAVADRCGVTTIGDQRLNAAQLATTRLESVYDADHLLNELTIID